VCVCVMSSKYYLQKVRRECLVFGIHVCRSSCTSLQTGERERERERASESESESERERERERGVGVSQ